MPFLNFRTAPPANHIDVVVAGKPCRIVLKRSARAQRLTLRVRNAQRDIVLTMPERSALAAAVDFAKRHVGWIEARLRKLPQRVAFEPGSVIPLRGVAHRIVHHPLSRKPVWIEAADAGTSEAALHLCVSGASAHLARRITDYLKREAQRDFAAAVAHHTAKLGKPATKITLRDTKGRWGSCSSRGSLNFSWRLVMAPSYVLDYLAAHEVAHLQHMDHSARFWALTNQLSADVTRAEAWLKAHGALLHQFGA